VAIVAATIACTEYTRRSSRRSSRRRSPVSEYTRRRSPLRSPVRSPLRSPVRSPVRSPPRSPLCKSCQSKIRNLMSANKFTHESLYEVYLLLINKHTNMLLEKKDCTLFNMKTMRQLIPYKHYLTVSLHFPHTGRHDNDLQKINTERTQKGENGQPL